jgi:peptidoglycan/xylan/chitin deacetylase (PgdA/CDA1 family)
MNWLERASREAVRMMQPFVPREAGGVTILTYHLIGAGTDSVVDVPVETFRDQLQELREVAHVCSLPEALRCLEAGTDRARAVAVVTFDDGFDNFRTRAWPVMRALEIPCTWYVPVGFLEGACGSPLKGAEALRPVPWSALCELASDPLLTIGSHSWSHRDLRFLNAHELRLDLRRSRERLEDRTGVGVEHFCYPRAKRSHAVERQVRTVYRTAVVAGGRRNLPGRLDPHRLGRVPIRRDMAARMTEVVQSKVWLEEWAASHARALVA